MIDGATLAEKFKGNPEVPDIEEHIAQSGIYVLGLQYNHPGGVHILGAFSSLEAATQAIPSNLARFQQTDPEHTYTVTVQWIETAPLIHVLPILRDGEESARFHVTVCPLNRY